MQPIHLIYCLTTGSANWTEVAPRFANAADKLWRVNAASASGKRYRHESHYNLELIMHEYHGKDGTVTCQQLCLGYWNSGYTQKQLDTWYRPQENKAFTLWTKPIGPHLTIYKGTQKGYYQLYWGDKLIVLDSEHDAIRIYNPKSSAPISTDKKIITVNHD